MTKMEHAMSRERTEQQARLIDAMLRAGPLTRSELMARTGFTRAVVADRVTELSTRGIVESESVPRSARGRPAALNRLAPGFGHVLAAVAGFSHIRIAVFDAAQGLLEQSIEDFDPFAPAGAVVEQVEAAYRESLARCSSAGPLRGICIGLPAPVEHPAGILVAPPDLPHWDGFEVTRAFETRLGAPCWTDNEVNLMAIGEHLARRCQPDDMIFVKIGHGIGAGIVGRGVLHRGADGSAGDIGHNRVPGSTVPCACGRTGCLGVTAGADAWARQGWDVTADVRARRGLPVATDATSRRDGATASIDGKRPALEDVLRTSGTQIGEALAALVNFYNPALVVFGGSVVLQADLLIATIREAVYANALPLATRRLTLERSLAEDMAGVTGAAFTAISGIHHVMELRDSMTAPVLAGSSR